MLSLDTLVGMFRPGETRWINLPRGIGFEVPRSRLLERLHQHVNCRVKVIVAPSGYGKTTLVAQFLRETRAPAVWLEAVPDDAEVLHFAKSLQLALSQISSESSQSDWLKLLETAPLTSALGTALKREIQSHPALELVVDNFEHLSQESRLWLSDLLEADLGAARIWLMGYDLEHLRLAKLVARGAAVILTQNDLRFDTDETQSVLEANHSIENPEEVCSRLDGWCAGVGLIAAGVSPHITPTNLIFDAINQLPKTLRERLPEAAVLEVWNENLAQELGCNLPFGWLNSIRRSGLPLSQINPDTYHPHRTLLEALEQQLQLNAPRHQALHNAAAESLLKRQESLGAIRHFLIAANRDAAINAAEPFAMRLSARGEHGLVCNMLQEIGEPRSATLAGLLGIALIETGQSEQGERLLKALEPTNYTPNAMFALGKLALRRGQAQTALDYSLQGQRLEGTPLELGRCRRLEGWALKNLGRLEEARQFAEREVAQAEADQNLEDLAGALMLLDAILIAGEQHMERENILIRGIQIYSELKAFTRTAALRNNLADLLRLQGRFDEAIREVQQGLEELETIENEALPYLLETLGDVYFWQQQHDQSRTFYRKAIQAAQKIGLNSSIFDFRLKLAGTMLNTSEHQQGLSLLEVLETKDQSNEIYMFMKGFSVFESQPSQAMQIFNQITNNFKSEWSVRAALLRAELARRNTQLERHHADKLIQVIQEHGFATAMFVDVSLSAPTLKTFVDSGWLSPKLVKHIKDFDRLSPAIESNRVRLEIQSLGLRQIVIDQIPVQVHLAKSFEVLVFLARNGPSSRETILGAIWNSDTPQSQRYFKVAIRRLRSDLQTHPDVTFNPVIFNDHYALASQFDIQLDLNQLESAKNDGSNNELESLLIKMQDNFLPGIEGEWVNEQRDLATEYSLLGNIKLGTASLETHPMRAVEAFQRALILDPFNSNCLLGLARAYLATNDFTAAKQAVERYVTGLRRELNIDLDPKTRKELELLELL